MRSIVVHQPAGPDLEFVGTLKAEASETEIGQVWIYETEAGNFVVEQKRSAFRGREARHRVMVFHEVGEVQECLGHSQAAKSLVSAIGGKTTRKVD